MDFISYLMGKKHGGGNAVDTGYYIKWSGDPTGLVYIDLDSGGLKGRIYKVSNAVLTAEQLAGAEVNGPNATEAIAGQGNVGVVDLGNCAIVAAGLDSPLVVSGLTGDYTVVDSGVTVEFYIPENGTYFVFFPYGGDYDNIIPSAGYYTNYIRKSAA